MIRSIVAFVRLGRPLFLGGGFILFALGAAIAAATGHTIDIRRYALGQTVVTAFQLMTHYANDYFDLEADRANASPTRWSGGSRVLPDGELPPIVALIAAIALAAIGAVVAGVLAHDIGELPAALLPTITLALAWSYSAPPMRLCARGLGELDTAIVVTALVPAFAFYGQAPDLRGGDHVLLSIVPLALLQFAMLLAIEFPDAAGDAATGKRTLVVRLGARRAAKLYVAVTGAAYLWLPLAVAFGLPGRVAIAGLVPAPIAAYRVARIAEHADPSAYERLTFAAVGLFVATSAAELIAWATI